MEFLVIDDEPEVAGLLQAALEGMGNGCTIAADADQADRVLTGRRIDAITLDLGLPGSRGGLDWLEGLALRAPGLARKTLVITGRSLGPEMAQRVARCGAGLLAKPFTLDALRAAVHSQIETNARGRDGEG